MMKSYFISMKNVTLTKEDENMLLNPNGWLNDQHLGKAMQILYKEKLQSIKYEQTYTIMRTINKNH